MPDGGAGYHSIPNGKISMGATHENEMGFDLTVDRALLNQMETEALAYYPEQAQAEVVRGSAWVHGPIPVTFHHFGAVPDRAGLYVASGLGFVWPHK